jgi:hypothetical protein
MRCPEADFLHAAGLTGDEEDQVQADVHRAGEANGGCAGQQ